MNLIDTRLGVRDEFCTHAIVFTVRDAVLVWVSADWPRGGVGMLDLIAAALLCCWQPHFARFPSRNSWPRLQRPRDVN